MIPSIQDCIWWLDHLEEGATIWDTEFIYIDRIMNLLEGLADEIDAANAAHAKQAPTP